MGRESKIKKLRKEGILEPVKIDKKRASALRKIFLWTTSLLLSFVLIFGIWAYAVKDIQASVNGNRITTLQVEDMLEPVRRSMQQQGIDPYSEDQVATIRQYEAEIVEMLIDQAIFRQYAKKHNISVAEEDLEQRINEEIDQIKSSYDSEEDYHKILASSELRNEENLRKEIRKAFEGQLLEEKVLETLFDKVAFNEEDALAFFNSPSSIEAQRILLEVSNFEAASEEEISLIETEIRTIREQLMNEEITFERAVERFSQDLATKTNAGSISLQEGVPQNEPELFEAARKMDIGEVSSIIRTAFGFSIVKVNHIAYNRERYDEPESAMIKSMTIQPDDETPLELTIDQGRPTGEERATGLVNTLREGKEKFDTIADLFAISPEISKEPQTVYRGQMDPAKEDIIFEKLQIMGISDPVPSANTFEIIKLIEKIPPKKADFNTLKESIMEEMTMREKSIIRNEWIEGQRNLTRISRSNPWIRMKDFFQATFGAFFEDIGNWVRFYTVDPKTIPIDDPSGGMDFTFPGDMNLDPDMFGEDFSFPFDQEGFQMDPEQFQIDFDNMPFDPDETSVNP